MLIFIGPQKKRPKRAQLGDPANHSIVRFVQSTPNRIFYPDTSMLSKNNALGALLCTMYLPGRDIRGQNNEEIRYRCYEFFHRKIRYLDLA